MEVAIDGEAVVLPSPVTFRSVPGAVRVRIPVHAPGASPAGLRAPSWQWNPHRTRACRGDRALAGGDQPAVAISPLENAHPVPADHLPSRSMVDTERALALAATGVRHHRGARPERAVRHQPRGHPRPEGRPGHGGRQHGRARRAAARRHGGARCHDAALDRGIHDAQGGRRRLPRVPGRPGAAAPPVDRPRLRGRCRAVEHQAHPA